MRKLIETFVKYPFYANILIVVITLGGILSAVSMKQSFFPEISSRFIQVQVAYPGASPTEMEEGVTSLIEEAIRGTVGVKEITSSSSENFASVNVEITGDSDIDKVLIDVKNAVDGIASFPTAAERPSVFKLRNRSMAIHMALYGDLPMIDLKNYADKIEEDLMNLDGVSQVSIQNDPVPEISIEINEEQLLRYDITFDEISNAVKMNNQDLSGGMLKTVEEEVLIRLRSRTADPKKIANIIVRGSANGVSVRLGDIATVTKKLNEDYYPSLMNGKNSIIMVVNKLNSEDLKVVTAQTEKYIEEFNAKNSVVKIEITKRWMDWLIQRLDLVINNGLMGLILVVISLALLLNFRLSLWVAWGIPSAFLAMFIISGVFGLITINMISLFGMILVIGILVDDGIVIGENIYTHFEKGKSPAQAAVDGTMEVAPAIITSVSTTIVAFAPILFLVGSQMEMMVEIAVVVVLSLGLSLAEAFLILPAHLANPKVLNAELRDKKPKGIKKYIEKGFMFLRERVYDKYIRWALKWRYFVLLGIPTFLFLLTIGLFKGGILKTTVFPNIDFDDFTINVAFTPGNGSEQTYKYLDKFEKAVLQANDEFTKKYETQIKEKFDTTLNIISKYSMQVGWAFSGEELGGHAGMLQVFPVELEGLGVKASEISARVQEIIGDLPEAEKFTIGGFNRWGAPISLSVMSNSNEEIEGAKTMLLNELSTYAELKDVKENNPLGKQEIKLKLKEKAHFLGLSEIAIAKQVRQGFYGEQIQRIQEGRNELRVWVRYPAEDRQFLGQLEQMKIKTPQGSYPLTELVEYTIERGPVNIKHLNGRKETRIEADMKNAEASVTDIIARVEAEVIPLVQAKYPDVYLEFQGQAKFGKEVGVRLGEGFGIAFVIILLILMLHFKSVIETFIVLAMIPLALLGAFWGHGFHGQMISMMSFQGIVALSGVIINDAVVFLSRYRDLMKEGYSVWDAVILAGKSRLRAIILTSITTSVGLLPLIAETSIQAQFLIPMAISLAYGVIFGTIFILLFFPVMIMAVNDYKRATTFYKPIFKLIIRFKFSKIKEYIENTEIPSREEVDHTRKQIKRNKELFA